MRILLASFCESVEGSLFGDKRIDRRAIKLLETMVEKCHLVIRQLAHDAAEQKAYRALLRNPKMRQATVVESLQAQCHRMVRGGHILAINDTTEINLQAHVGRVRAEELGVIGDGKSLGFFLHPTLVLCAQTGEALGLSSVQSWTRPETKPNKHERDYKRQAIAEKESYKWLRAAQETKAVLAEADMITMIAEL